MTNLRAYSAATRAALAAVSRGRCYNPDCPTGEPIIQFVEGEPFVNYEIAHIRDARPGNRYAPDATDEERRAFANLVLLCRPCHSLVDRTNASDYSIERLDGWKRLREGSYSEALAALGPVGQEALENLVVPSVQVPAGNPELTVGETGGIVRVSWGGMPRLLPLEPATVGAGKGGPSSRLMRARSRVVPFTVHHELSVSLLDWCLDGVAFSARIVGGGPGTGKTRLGVELCEQLAAFGWVCGLLTPVAEQAALDALVAAPTPRLVVVDYAETRLAELATILPRLAAFATVEHPARVLLLVRAQRRRDWTAALRDTSHALDALLDDMTVDALDAIPIAASGREALFSAAVNAFAQLAADDGTFKGRPGDLSGPAFATPLAVVAAAYLYVYSSARQTHGRGEPFEELLAHEDRYWKASGPDAPTDRIVRRRIVALATLAGAATEAEAADRLRLVPDLADADEGVRRVLARWAHRLYGGAAWWNPIEPDLLAEHLVATTYQDDSDVLAGVLVGTADSVSRPVNLYARAASGGGRLAATLPAVLNQELPRLCQLAIDQTAEETNASLMPGDATLAAALSRWVRATGVETNVLRQATDLLPRRFDFVLNPLALALTDQLVHGLRSAAAGNPSVYEPDLATSLNNLSGLLADAGRRAEGLAAIEEALAIRRRLAAANPAAYDADLASSLNNVSLRLADVGRRDEALGAIEDAVSVYRRLAAGNPAVYEPPLATSLNNLSGRLADAGRRDEGLAAIDEAVAIRRRLAAANPAAYEPDLASSLNNVSLRLADVGRRDEALVAIEGAVEIRRRLAARNPAAYEPDLASSLNNLSAALAATGRRDEGLSAIEEAVAEYRRLAAANPAAYAPDLATAVNNLSNRLADMGRDDEALDAIEEAVEIRRRLASANPAAYESDLAGSLNNLALDLAETGRRAEGLAAIQEAVEVYRRLTAANPAAYEPAVAMSLSNLSVHLADAGRPDEALAAIEQAVDVRRRLASGNPAAHEAGLAGSLNYLSVRLAEAGRSEESLVAIEEAVEIHRRMAAANPAAYEPALATSLNNLSARLAEAGRSEESLVAIEEAVEVHRRVAAANPAAYEPALATSLNNLSDRLAEEGRRDESLAAINEAVEVYLRLAAANPAAYEPDLATLLNSLSVHLTATGRREQGLAAMDKATEIKRRQAASGSAEYGERELASPHHNPLSRQTQLGRFDDRLAAVDEAVNVYRGLETADAGPIHVLRVELRNFKVFDNLVIDGLGEPSLLGGRWTCLAGINGAGKTSILQAICMALLGPSQAVELGGERLRKMVRRVGTHPVVSAAEVTVTVREGSTNHVLVLPLGIPDEEDGEVRPTRGAAVWERLRSRLVLAYGATRNIADYRDTRWDGLSPQVRQQMTLFDPFTQVASVGVLLGETPDSGKSVTPALEMLLELLERVFGGEEVGLARWSIDPSTKRLSFEQEGAVVDAAELPDGFRSLVAWLTDLCSAWFRVRPYAGPDPAEITGIVMVDEIDLHLHSRLQRLLVPRLRMALPNVQWIVTTHSPLILSSFVREELVLLDRTKPGGIWNLDRDIIGFSSDEVYEWLLDTNPRSAAIDERAANSAPEDDIALLLYQSPSRSATEAAEELRQTEAQIRRLKRRRRDGK